MITGVSTTLCRTSTGFRTAIGRLAGVLAPHNTKEEQILYPMTDRAGATPDDRDDLAKCMQLL